MLETPPKVCCSPIGQCHSHCSVVLLHQESKLNLLLFALRQEPEPLVLNLVQESRTLPEIMAPGLKEFATSVELCQHTVGAQGRLECFAQII